MQGLRRSHASALAAGLVALAGCTAANQAASPALANQAKPEDVYARLQAEGVSPADVPAYLIGRNGTFVTNGLMPEPWGDTE